MAKNTKWNKRIFAMLLEDAKGPRSWRQFAADCDISYVQMRKLALGTQENPPRPKLIRKVAANTFVELELSDFMYAAGIHIADGNETSRSGGSSFIDKYASLSAKDKKLADKFVDFLAAQAVKK